MSITVLSGQGISNHSLNHSVSKQMYSFPKSPRFRVINKSSSATFLYNIPSKVSQRKTFIGYGTKSDFTKIVPSNAHFYNIVREFDNVDHPYIDFKNNPHYSFGLSKEHMLKRVINGKTSEIKKESPGPAEYNYLKPFGSFSPKYSMGLRFNSKNLTSNYVTPGPAKYKNNLVLNKRGHYFLSNFHNSTLYSIGKEKRFNYKKDITPGPSDYNLGYLINGTGMIYNSIYKSSNSKTIAKKYRGLFDRDNGTPGPGSYTMFSEFGIYRSKNADINLKKRKNNSVNIKNSESLNASFNSTGVFSSMAATYKGIFFNKKKLVKKEDINRKINLKKYYNNNDEKNDYDNINNGNKGKKANVSKKNEEQNLEYKEKVSIDDKIRKKDNVIDYGNRKDKNSKIDKSEKKIIKEEEEKTNENNKDNLKAMEDKNKDIKNEEIKNKNIKEVNVKDEQIKNSNIKEENATDEPIKNSNIQEVNHKDEQNKNSNIKEVTVKDEQIKEKENKEKDTKAGIVKENENNNK